MGRKEKKKEKDQNKTIEKAAAEEKAKKQDELPEKDQESYEQIFKICGLTMEEARNLTGDLITGNNPSMEMEFANGEIHITVSARAEGDKSAKKVAKPVIKEIKSRFSEKIYALDRDTSLARTVFDLLSGNSLTLATAESCTGGMIAARLVDMPGISEVFKEGFITYSNKAKRSRLGVKKSTLLRYGAVSAETVREMAKGGAFFSKADICVAVSGTAGPDGGTEEKPVGTVFVGCCIKGKTVTKECHFKGDRNQIREQAVTEAFSLIRRCVLKYYSEKNFGV
ncbi:MAG: nicotinamide-nucleotide amidohydrolase family protein [Lachnospiraceae bacterium]|nr:nicotinamide-nucleotide amidohydrolase family protein [Lachnospiraceae bacterium]